MRLYSIVPNSTLKAYSDRDFITLLVVATMTVLTVKNNNNLLSYIKAKLLTAQLVPFDTCFPSLTVG